MRASPVAVALLLDLYLGDPYFSWHPVRMMGRLIKAVEKRMTSKAAGLALALGLPSLCWALAWTLLREAGRQGPWLAWGLSCLLIYFCVACRDMLRHARRVLRALKSEDLA